MKWLIDRVKFKSQLLEMREISWNNVALSPGWIKAFSHLLDEV